MSLFDIFKKKAPSHSEKVDMAYRCYKPETVGVIFPGGNSQVGIVISSLAKIYNLNLEACDAKKYYDILTTYSDVVIRRIVTQSPDDLIITSLQINHGDLIRNKDIAKKVLAYTNLNMKNNEFSLNSENDFFVLNLITNIYSQQEQTVSENSKAEKDNLDDPEYGLVVNKPIYTQGVSGSNEYLTELKTTLGEKLIWKRVGSTSVNGINGMIDIYVGTLPSGKTYKTLYLNMYGSCNSKKIPKGFKK